MFLRTDYEEFEGQNLSRYAKLSSESVGREREEVQCTLRTVFQRDRDRVVHCKAFRRLKHKTQVFIAPEGDHYRTRLTHTLEVSQVARAIARALRLNEDLTEAIALAHDLGHTPFGHTGEEALSEKVKTVGGKGFSHNEQSLRVVEEIEFEGAGLNLTWEVRNGVAHHTGQVDPQTLEGCVVKIADRVAYINHDIDDALRAGLLSVGDLPRKTVKELGESSSSRINSLVMDIVRTSDDKPYIKQSEEVAALMDELRNFLFDRVYIGSKAKIESDKAKRILSEIFDYYYENPSALPTTKEDGVTQSVVDYIAGMTDRYVIKLYGDLFIPKPWTE